MLPVRAFVPLFACVKVGVGANGFTGNVISSYSIHLVTENTKRNDPNF